MGTSGFAALAGVGRLAALLFIVTGIVIAALLLSLAFRMLVGRMPSFLRALAVVALSFVATLVLTFVLKLVLPEGLLSGLLLLATQFLVGAAVINLLLPASDGNPIGYGKACLVQLVYMVLGIVLGLVIGLIVVALFGSSLLAGLH
jgi:hypothetical protein